MLDQEEFNKFIRNFKKWNKPNLFLPIFYSVIFGLVIISLLLIPEYNLFVRIGGCVLLIIVLCLFWYAYDKEKRSSKENAQYIEDLIERYHHGEDIDHEFLTEEETNRFKKQIKQVIKYLALTYLHILLIFIILEMYKVVALYLWIRITTYVLFGFGIVIFGILTLISYLKLVKTSKQFNDSKNK